jgi:hypothetical protein
MQDGTPYWEPGRTDDSYSSYPLYQLMMIKPNKLETDLVQFVNEHPETFSPEEMENIKRGVIRAFGLFAAPFESRGDRPWYKPGLSATAQLILGTISDKTTRGREINTTQDVMNTLTNFEVCVEFINKFLPDLCKTEQAYTQSTNGFNGSNKWKCERIAHAVSDSWSHSHPNIFRNFQNLINRYQARVLQLWADVLIREGKIKPEAIAQMKTEVDAKDGGYEKKMHALIAEYGGGFSFKQNLHEPMLLKWLTLFHVAIAKDPYMTNLTKKYDNEGKASTLDGIIFGIISQFVPINNVSGYSYIPQSNKHESELNMLHLTCNVVAKNPPVSGPNAQQPPVYAYLSSDVLDQCMQSVGRFPNTDEFIQYMNTRMIEKAAAFSAPPPPPPAASAPPLSELESELGGGKKTRRKTNKKLKNVKKSKKCKKSHRRFIKRYSR